VPEGPGAPETPEIVEESQGLQQQETPQQLQQQQQQARSNARLMQAIDDTINDVRAGMAGDVQRPPFRNIGQGEAGEPLLPNEAPEGGRPPVYEEYAVVDGVRRSAQTGQLVESNHLGGARLIYDRSNDVWWFTSNIHARSPVFERVQPPPMGNNP
jgi:hypothetical protein